MLDNETRRRIDSARDILVGKVPDPKSQVEQITIALIYKFMDDMDRESEELGGKASFFTGAYKEFAWCNLLDTSLSGHKRLQLYAEGLEKMSANAKLPQLFRDIFRGAFLPYRDPETLNLFLKEINNFTYEHSERLGDAFEYLLQVLGSQGDAGQFRTPRHIIDFIVSVVAPRKNETVLDPACGTAGFLISAFKHILQANGKSAPGDRLTGDERAALMKNFVGYDISPDFVRLSRANMYLHGFAQPAIHEYDTLTSEERWDERYDVIMANPPFMTPKGGIRPHNRFSLQATRSEVLFVDYIVEHLTPQGRGAVIVPEGIVFKCQNAYKALRRTLVENYLWAVVSLPAGVFNPYSDVKTSILFFDRALAKKRADVLFVKVENDGFDLGAQRREIGGSQLPEAHKLLLEFHGGQEVPESARALSVARKRLLANGDVNLTGDRYRMQRQAASAWPTESLADVSAINRASVSPEASFGKRLFTYVDISSVENGTGKISYETRLPGSEAPSRARRVIQNGDVLISTVRPNLKAFAYIQNPPEHVVASTGFAVLTPTDALYGRFLYHLCMSEPFVRQLVSCMGKGAYPSVTQEDVGAAKIPLPPLDVQRQIVEELDRYQTIVDAARQIVSSYKANVTADPRWPNVQLGEIIDGKPKNGYSGTPVPYATEIKVLSLSATTSGNLDANQFKYLDEEIASDAHCRCRYGDIYLQRGNTRELVGTAALFDIEDTCFVYPDLMIRVRANETKILTEFLLYSLQSEKTRTFIRQNAVGAAGSMPKINQTIVESIPISLPSLSTQQRIVTELRAERALIDSNRELITRFEKKIQDKLAEIWGEAPAGGPVVVDTKPPSPGRTESFSTDEEAEPEEETELETAQAGEPAEPEDALAPDADDEEVEEDEEDESELLPPRLATKSTGTSAAPAQSIDDYTREDLLCIVRDVFERRGVKEGYDRETAIYDIASALNFQRVGPRIREAIENALLTAVRRCIIWNDDGILRLNLRNIGDYPVTGKEVHNLRDYLLSAMGTAWRTEEEAIRLAARSLGYARTGAKITEAFQKAIASALRRGELERYRDLIRRAR